MQVFARFGIISGLSMWYRHGYFGEIVKRERLYSSAAEYPHVFLNCTDNYDAAKTKVKSVTDHQ